MTGHPEMTASLTAGDHNGPTHVFLDPAGDHIVVKAVTDRHGKEIEITLSPGSWAYDRAISRASRGVAFL